MSAPIRIGIVGSGGYGRTARQYLRNTGEYKIVACMDVSRRVAERAAEDEGAVAYTDLDALLGDDLVEAVSINTPVLLHAQHARSALMAGKHVFITKPVTNSVVTARALKTLALKKRRAFMVGHHARHAPDIHLAGKLLKAGRIGRLCNVVATCCSSAGLEQKKGDWRTAAGKNPGGPLLQCGIHTIDVLLGLFGPVRRVMAVMQDDITPFDVVDNTLTLIDFRCGVQAAFLSNYTTAYLHTVSFMGTKGNLHLHHHITGLGQGEMYFQPRARGPHEPWQALAIPPVKGYPDTHRGVLEKEFARQIRRGAPNYANLDDAIAALAVIEAAVRSHKTGRAVVFPSSR